MEKTTYLAEIKAPHIEITDAKDIVRASKEIDEYFKKLEVYRLDFVESLSSCREKVALAYLDELVDARKVALLCAKESIEGVNASIRHYSEGICREALFNSFLRHKVVFGIKASIDKAIDFVRLILPDDTARSVEEQISSMKKQEKQNEHEKREKHQPEDTPQKNVSVISGTSALADYLGCGRTKAFAIIKSGKLEKVGIQYKVGNCWKFNAAKLKQHLVDNPKFLE